MIRVFLPNETDFTSNGERVISLRKCVEHRGRIDWYIDIVANLEYSDVIQNDYIIVVKTKEKGYQPFRVKNPKLTNRVEAKAEHIGFDLKNYACALSTILNESCLSAMNKLLVDSEDATPFAVYTNISGLKTFSNIDTNLLEGFKKIANEFNGELDFDGWQVRITGSIGVDRGVVLSYGNNIQESEVNENWDLVVTKLKPIGNDGITLSPEWLSADISYQRPYTKIMTFDSDNIENLQLAAQLYLDRYKVPRVNYKVKADVEQNVGLGDAIVVRAKQFTVNAEVLAYDFDVIKNRVISVEFGNYRPTVKSAVAERFDPIEENIGKVQIRIDEVNKEINLFADDFNELSKVVDGVSANSAGIKLTPTEIVSTVRSSTEYTGDLNSKENNVIKQNTAPAHEVGRLWLNTSVTPNVLNRSTGSAWVKATPTTAGEVGAFSSIDGGALTTRVTHAETSISQQSGAIALKADQTTVNAVSAVANSKAKTFLSTPTTPYYVGDIWIDTNATTGANRVCTTQRLTGAYVASDWTKEGVTSRLDSAEQKITPTAITSTVRSSTEYTGDLNAKENNVFKQNTAPAHAVGRLWLNTSVAPNVLNHSTGSAWIKATPTQASEVGAFSATDGSALTTRVTHAETSITQQSEAIALRATKTEVTQAINNVQVGGRNLLKNTSSEWTELTMGTSHFVNIPSDVKLEVGQTYTLSLIVEKVSSDSVPINVHVGLSKFPNGTYIWDFPSWRIQNINFGEKISITYTVKESDIVEGTREFFTYRLRNETLPTTIRYKVEKLEKGNKATDWTPAPEDVDSKINGIETRVSDAELKITPTAITSTVRSSTEYTTDQNAKENTIFKQNTAPAHLNGRFWLNTSVTPNVLNRSNGTAWVRATPTQASEVGAYSSSDGTALAGRVSTAETSITQQAGQIALKADQTTVNAVSAVANSKAKTFLSTPTTPYYVGDIWIDTNATTGGNRVCTTQRLTGAYVASDWTKEGVTSRIDSAELKITPTAITSTVRNSTEYTNDLGGKVGTNEIVSRINQTAEQVKIQASKISLEGLVTVNSRFKILADGSMEATNGIFSGNITANTGSIGRFAISDNDLVYTSDLFDKEYDYSDIAKLRRILAGLLPQTAYDLAVYDVNNSGTLTTTDLVIIRGYVDGTGSMTPKKIRSIIRVGTTSGEIKTTAVAQNGSLGPTFDMKAEKLSGNLMNVQSIASESLYTKRISFDGDIYRDLEQSIIIDSGSNSNGSWIKYGDGTMICYHRIDSVLSISPSLFSGMYRSFYTWNFPQSFISPVRAEILGTIMLNDVVTNTSMFSDGDGSTTQGLFVFLGSATYNQLRRPYLKAIGRWK